MSAFVAIVAGVVGGLAALPGAASADEDPVFVITDLDTRGPTTAFFVRVASGEDHTPVDVTWEVVPASTPDAAPLLTGAASGVPAGQVPAIGTNDVLTHGARYLYRGTFEADVEPYGQVVDEATTRFTWDDTVGATAIRLDSRDYYLGKWFTDVNRFYPARDDGRTATWRDRVRVVLQSEEAGVLMVDVTIRDEGGDVVRSVRLAREGAGGDGSGSSRRSGT